MLHSSFKFTPKPLHWRLGYKSKIELGNDENLGKGDSENKFRSLGASSVLQDPSYTFSLSASWLSSWILWSYPDVLPQHRPQNIEISWTWAEKMSQNKFYFAAQVYLTYCYSYESSLALVTAPFKTWISLVKKRNGWRHWKKWLDLSNLF